MSTLIRDLFFIYLIFGLICLIIYITNKKIQPNIYNIFSCMIFTFFLYAIYAITGISPISGFHTNINLNDISYIPFDNIGIIIKGALNHGNLWYAIENICGNIILFIPVGFFLPLVSKSFKKLRYTLLFGVSISLIIECSQLFLIRGTDIDDIILNTTGTILGYIIYILFTKLFTNITKKCVYEEDTIKNTWFILPIISIFLPYITTIIGGFIDRGIYIRM